MKKSVMLPVHADDDEVVLHFVWDETEKVWVCKMEDAFMRLFWPTSREELRV